MSRRYASPRAYTGAGVPQVSPKFKYPSLDESTDELTDGIENRSPSGARHDTGSSPDDGGGGGSKVVRPTSRPVTRSRRAAAAASPVPASSQVDLTGSGEHDMSSFRESPSAALSTSFMLSSPSGGRLARSPPAPPSVRGHFFASSPVGGGGVGTAVDAAEPPTHAPLLSTTNVIVIVLGVLLAVFITGRSGPPLTTAPGGNRVTGALPLGSPITSAAVETESVITDDMLDDLQGPIDQWHQALAALRAQDARVATLTSHVGKSGDAGGSLHDIEQNLSTASDLSPTVDTALRRWKAVSALASDLDGRLSARRDLESRAYAMLRQLKSLYAQLTRQVATYQSEHAHLDVVVERLDELQQAIGAAQVDADNAQRDVEQFDQSMNRQSGLVSQLHEQLSKADVSVRATSDKVASQEAVLQRVTADLRELQTELDETAQSVVMLRQRRRELLTERASLDPRRAELEATSGESSIHAWRARVARSEQHVQQVTSYVEEIEKLVRLGGRVWDLRDLIARKAKDLEQLERELESVRLEADAEQREWAEMSANATASSSDAAAQDTMSATSTGDEDTADDDDDVDDQQIFSRVRAYNEHVKRLAIVEAQSRLEALQLLHEQVLQQDSSMPSDGESLRRDLTDRQAAATARLAEHRRRLQSLAEELTSLNNRTAALQSELTDVDGRLAKAQRRVEVDLQDRRQTLEEQRRAAADFLQSLQGEVDRARRTRNDIAARLEAALGQVRSRDSMMAQKQERVMRTRQALLDAKRALVAELMRQSSALRLIDQMRDEVEQADASFRSAQSDVSATYDTLVVAGKEIEGVAVQLQAAMSSCPSSSSGGTASAAAAARVKSET